jgi:hypothetical protein
LVNFELGDIKKNEHDLQAKKDEKERSTSFQQAFRITVRPLFATKHLDGGGVGKKLIDE